MSSLSFLNQDFGSEDEEEDEEFTGDAENKDGSEGEGEDLGAENNEDDEDGGDDEEDEEEDEVDSGRPRKRRRNGVNIFFEEEAEVDEDDDDEAEEDEGQDGFVADTHPDDLDQFPEGEQEDDRRHRELDRQRQLEASMDAEKQAEALRQRYGRRTATGMGAGSFVPQNLLMPDVNDPSIWGVRCRPGKEREVILAIQKKLRERIHTKNPMKICSAFERGNGPMAGYIFVEARKKADVDDALSNIPDVYPRGKTNLVPVKEMPDLLRVTKSQELVRDGYVRIKRGLYTGDLAMIEDVESNGLSVTVRLVPRLTYGLDEDDQKSPLLANNIGPDGKRKRPGAFGGTNNVANRPPPRLFNEVEAKKRHSRFLTPGRGPRAWNYKNDLYEDGFLIKEMRLQHLITTDVNPRLDEITKLTRTAADGTETLDLESLAHTLRNNTAEGSYMPGDEVEVYEGEQKGIVGKTEAVQGNIVSIKVSEGDLSGQLVEVPMKGLRKRFQEGAHVKIIGGSRYRDEVGMVIAIKDDRVTVLTDTSMQEITVFSKDLREATDGGGGTSGQANKFDVQDLVQLEAALVGCVVKADRDSVRVLDQDGSISTRLPSQITKVEERRNAVATDKNGSEIRVGDGVREVGGEGKSGTILHVHRSFLFLHNKTQLENSGLWTTRCTNVVTTAAKGGRITGPMADLTKMNPALQMKNGGAPAMAPPVSRGFDRLIKQRVKIRKGEWKGFNGLVKDTTDTMARIELESKNKLVNIDKNSLNIIDPHSGKVTDYQTFIGSRGGFPSTMRTGGAGTSRTPDVGYSGRTPMGVADGGRTPAWGSSSSRTPAWGGAGGGSGADSSRTPAWKGPGGGSQTTYGGVGNMTTYGGVGNYGASANSNVAASGRTPAWSSSARTPYGTDHGFGSSNNNAGSGFDAFAAGSRTPAYGGNPTTTSSTSRTPAWSGGPSTGGINSAPTPGRSYDAPTPAASAPTPRAFEEDAYTPMPYQSAPTPGAGFGGLDAPTPAALPAFAKGANNVPLKFSRFDAPTPGARAYDAPTPGAGAYDAPTPAAGGGGGPRYAEDSDEE